MDLEPHGHWKTITFVAALRQNGMTAPCTIDGAMNGGRFLTYIERCLAPTLTAQRHRDARQSSGAQGRRCPRGHRSARGNASIPAQIFPRPEPDRDVLQPDEGRSAQGRGAHNSSPPPPDQVIRSDHHPSPSRQLFQARGLCVKSIGICSKWLLWRAFDNPLFPTKNDGDDREETRIARRRREVDCFRIREAGRKTATENIRELGAKAPSHHHEHAFILGGVRTPSAAGFWLTSSAFRTTRMSGNLAILCSLYSLISQGLSKNSNSAQVRCSRTLAVHMRIWGARRQETANQRRRLCFIRGLGPGRNVGAGRTEAFFPSARSSEGAPRVVEISRPSIRQNLKSARTVNWLASMGARGKAWLPECTEIWHRHAQPPAAHNRATTFG